MTESFVFPMAALSVSVSAPLLEALDLDFSYGGRQILAGIALSVRESEVVALMGDNGSGKTTLLSLLAGRLSSCSGQILWRGQDITRDSLPARARRGLGFLPQHSSVLGQATVEENLRFVRQLLPSEPAPPPVDDLLERFGLEGLKEQRAASLSGGERRRLELARTFLSHPRLLLLDEPFAGLDSPSITSLCGLLGQLGHQHAILVSDHQAEVVGGLAHRRLRMADGTLSEES